MTQKGMKKPGGFFNAVVLAGERTRDNPLNKKFHVPAKALISVGGKPMVQRVLEALTSSGYIRHVYLCGPERALFDNGNFIGGLFDSGVLKWIENEKTPSLSALKALKLACRELPVLLTTADHALLTKHMVRFFCTKALKSDRDLLVALARLEMLKEKYPETRRTSYRFREGRFCTCNMFGFMKDKAFQAARFWRKVEENRKNPLKIVGSFGWWWALRYVTGTLGIEQAFRSASTVLDCSAGPVIMPFPEAAIDVDSPGDLELAERIITQGLGSGPGTGEKPTT